MKRKPSSRAMMRFMNLWFSAQKKRDIKRMESLLDPHWLNYWWWIWQEAPRGSNWESDCRAAVGDILASMGLVGYPPIRPSERAMAMMDAQRKGKL